MRGGRRTHTHRAALSLCDQQVGINLICPRPLSVENSRVVRLLRQVGKTLRVPLPISKVFLEWDMNLKYVSLKDGIRKLKRLWLLYNFMLAQYTY